MTRLLHLKTGIRQWLPNYLTLLLVVFGGFQTLNAQLQVTLNVTDALCFGLPNGRIVAVASNGTPAYNFAWSNGATGAVATGLAAGTYSVTVTDAGGQTIVRSATVNQPALVTAVLTVDELCNAPFNITANPGGGIPPYGYNWSNGGMTQTIANVPAGQYCVTVTDSNLCGVPVCITVNANPPSVSVQTTNVTCPGGTNGSVTAVHIGGVPPYTYVWSNGGVGQTLNNLGAGSYTVTLTDGNGCTAVATGTVVQPAAISINLNRVNPNCVGDTNGSITSAISGGTPPYTLLWNTGASTPNLTNLGPGTYTLTVVDARGCTQSASISLAYRSNLTLGGLGTPITCPGLSNGFATANPQNGVMPYTYLWNNGWTQQVLMNAAPGNYSVTVTDAAGCVATTVVVVPDAPAFSVAAAGSNPTTCGVNNGTATVNVLQGVGPFTYLWNTGANTQSISNLGAGTYTVTVTNGNGCITSSSTTLVAPPNVFASATATPRLCPGVNNGTATATATGGTPPFGYAWSNGGNTQTITGLSPGTYSVIVTDANGCSSIASVTIQQAPGVTFNLTGTTTVCGVGNTGSATATPTGGTAPFSYLWSTGAVTSSVTGLPEGTHSVTVTDANGCSAVRTISINVIDDLNVNLNGVNPECFGFTNGSVTALPTGGNAPYTYVWNTGATTPQIINRGAGTYSVTITDANDCTAQRSTTLTQPPLLTVGIQSTNPLNCFGAANASLTATAQGGTPGYGYAWSNGQTGPTISNLPAGTYTVTVTDANECTATASFVVTQTQAILVNITGQSVYCGAENSGFAGTVVSGGTAPYSYVWSTGAITESISNIPNGTYSVTVMDANGCTGVASKTIRVISDLGVNLIPRNVLCFGDNSGSVLAIPSGGDMPYTFRWSTGSTANEITNIVAGTYSVTLTEANGCTVQGSVMVNQPTLLTASTTRTNPGCPGSTNGTASVVASGGTPPYQYAWSSGGNTASVSGLGAGIYTVTVTDLNLCTTTASVTLTNPQGITVNVSAPTITCGGTATGTATAIVTGGTGTYTYLWSNGQITQTATNLAAGTYGVTVTDGNGCTQVASGITLNELPAVQINFSITNLECTSAPVGAVTATVSNGTPPYIYAWSNGRTTATINNLASGIYTLTVTDANGCRAVRSAEIGQTAGFTAGAPGTMVTCFGANNGTATVVTNGGQAPFAYVWSNSQTTQTVNNLAPGTYSVTVTDTNECFAVASVVITQPTLLVANISGTNILCNGDANGTVTVSPTGGTPPYSIVWSTGQAAATITVAAGGTYTVTVTDANGCVATNSRVITEPTPLNVTITQNSGTCSNVTQGILVANVTGGTTGYTYLWSNGATTQTASNLAPGTYMVTVTDANDCVRTATAALTTFPAPSCSVAVLQPSTLGNNGSVQVSVTSGTAPFSYDWSNGGNTAILTGLAPGTYTVTVSDANGCQTVCSATLAALAGIGNYVWEDIDHDGQQDANEPPIPNITVNLKNAAGDVIATTVTDANGEYYFLSLTPGTYSVQFVIPAGLDYTASNQGNDALDSDILPGMNGMTGTYTLAPGELNFTVDGGLFVPPNGVIADPCNCLNNATTEINGQFYEVFTVRSYPNETWIVTGGAGMFVFGSPEPPASPIPVTYPLIMTEVSPGIYEYGFRIVHDIPYSVVATNGFSTLTIGNQCRYPRLNITELPPLQLCLADEPIQLNATPEVPGNLIFRINGMIVTEIDPLALNVDSYELVATLVPLDPETCEANIVTQFEITDDCLATVGDRVWLDLNCDGIQGGNEPGIPGVEVRITGTAEFLNPNVDMVTYTDAQGYYSFTVPPGNYKLTFGTVPGYNLTAPNQGSDDNRDSDVNPLTMMTDFFHLSAYEVNLSFDMGLCPECINVTYPGAIGNNQYLCAPGNDPAPFVSLAPASGGDGPIEYMWMYTNGFVGTPIQYWTPIPNSNSPTYDSGPLQLTTFFARCARTENCGTFLETNVIEVRVGNETQAIINGPGLVCWNQPTTFTAAALEPGSTVVWRFTGGATPATVTGPTATVIWSSVGVFQVELQVTRNGCTATAYKTITITTSPTSCNQGLQISSSVTNPDAGEIMVSWEMSSLVTGLTYEVEHAPDGVNFERIAVVNEAARQQNGVHFFEHYSSAPKKGINYYRVKVIDENGASIHSNIAEVILYEDSKIAMLYPNPVNDRLYVEIFETFGAQEVFVEVFSVSGKLLNSIPVAQDARQLDLDFGHYPAGAYMVRLRLGETNIRTMKVIKR